MELETIVYRSDEYTDRDILDRVNQQITRGWNVIYSLKIGSTTFITFARINQD